MNEIATSSIDHDPIIGDIDRGTRLSMVSACLIGTVDAVSASEHTGCANTNAYTLYSKVQICDNPDFLERMRERDELMTETYKWRYWPIETTDSDVEAASDVQTTFSDPQSRTQENVRMSSETKGDLRSMGLTQDVEHAASIIRKCYSLLHELAVRVATDPEAPDRTTVQFILTVSGDIDDLLTEEDVCKSLFRSTLSGGAWDAITVTYRLVDETVE